MAIAPATLANIKTECASSNTEVNEEGVRGDSGGTLAETTGALDVDSVATGGP